MPTYTIILSDVEQKAFEYVATDVDFWIQNAVHERARLAMEEMVADTIKMRLDTGTPIQGSREDIVMMSNLPNAQARNDAAVAQMLTSVPTQVQ